jgi:hypothetical protein
MKLNTIITLHLVMYELSSCWKINQNFRSVQDLPDDPTGELDKIKDFLEENLDICKWVALSVVVLEVSALLTLTIESIILHSFTGPGRRTVSRWEYLKSS